MQIFAVVQTKARSIQLHLEQVKVLLILGAEEGVFPQTPAGCPLFGEEEEELLAQRYGRFRQF